MSPEAAAALLGQAETGRGALAVGAVVFVRVGALMALLPAFGEQVVPMRVRLCWRWPSRWWWRPRRRLGSGPIPSA